MQFSFLSFFLGLAIGTVVNHLNTPSSTKIIKYPSPFNAEKVIYKGLSGDCYKVSAKSVKCSSEAIKQPII